MYPILVQLGPITIYSLWICAAIGFFVAFLIVYKLLQKDRNALNFLAEHCLAIFLGGLIVSRLVFVIYNYKSYFSQIDLQHFFGIFFIWDKGLSLWGGLLGAALTLAHFCQKGKENIWKWFDTIIIGIMGGLVAGNIGAFLDGSHYGNETNLPWGVVIENSRFAVPIHPVQIYAALYTLGITLTLWNLRTTGFGKKEGNILLSGAGLYAIFRFLEEFLRGDESNYFLGMREAQIYCIIAVVAAGILLYLRNKKTAKNDSIINS